MKHNLIYAGVKVKNASFSCNAVGHDNNIFSGTNICSRDGVNMYV